MAAERFDGARFAAVFGFAVAAGLRAVDRLAADAGGPHPPNVPASSAVVYAISYT